MPKDFTHVLFLSDGNKLPVTVHFSDRRTISVEIKSDLSVHVRAPRFCNKREALSFLQDKASWIEEHYIRMQNKKSSDTPALSKEQEARVKLLEKRFRKAAAEFFPRRCAELQRLTGGYYTSVSIRNQKTRWGSCSSSGTLSFNYRLMMAPPAIIDYVIVHELCHLTYMNHSEDFWNKVASVLPDYKEKRKWLKDHGHELTEVHYLLSLK